MAYANGYFNPGNPFDTGQPNSENRETLQRYLDAGRQSELMQMGWDPNAPVHWHDNPASGLVATGGGSSGGGSSMFANPYYQQAEAATRAQGASDLASTRGAIQQLLIQFGLVPEGFQDKMGVLDDTIRSLIQKNTESGISQYARMNEAKDDVRKQTVAEASATGRRRSGAYGYRLRRNQLNSDRTFSDTLSALLGEVGGAQSGYASREYGRQMNLSQFLSQLFSNWNPSGGASASRSIAPPGGTGGGSGFGSSLVPGLGSAPANASWNPTSGYYTQPSGQGGRFILD